MWSISNKLGFKGGLVLEPSIGTGRFIGMTPDNLKIKKQASMEQNQIQ